MERLKMRQIIIFLLMFLTALILHNTAKAQPNLNATANLAVLQQQQSGYHFTTLPLISADGQRSYRIYIAIPDQKAPAGGFPAFYALDGNAVLDFLTPANMQILAKQPYPPVLVLLGYATDKRFNAQARAYDYTIAPDNDNIDPLDSSRINGGANIFLNLIRHQIMPAVQQMVPININAQTLWGHSYGGLMVLHTLFTQPNLFQHYIAADPSIWLHGNLLQQEATDMLKHQIALSGSSLWILNSKLKAGKIPKNPQIAARIRIRNELTAKQDSLGKKLVYELQQHTNLTIKHENFPEENHGSMFGKSLQLALFHPIVRQ
jgi:uncharacterized protein